MTRLSAHASGFLSSSAVGVTTMLRRVSRLARASARAFLDRCFWSMSASARVVGARSTAAATMALSAFFLTRLAGVPSMGSNAHQTELHWPRAV